jgi:hypothetical protein
MGFIADNCSIPENWTLQVSISANSNIVANDCTGFNVYPWTNAAVVTNYDWGFNLGSGVNMGILTNP